MESGTIAWAWGLSSRVSVSTDFTLPSSPTILSAELSGHHADARCCQCNSATDDTQLQQEFWQ